MGLMIAINELRVSQYFLEAKPRNIMVKRDLTAVMAGWDIFFQTKARKVCWNKNTQANRYILSFRGNKVMLFRGEAERKYVRARLFRRASVAIMSTYIVTPNMNGLYSGMEPLVFITVVVCHPFYFSFWVFIACSKVQPVRMTIMHKGVWQAGTISKSGLLAGSEKFVVHSSLSIVQLCLCLVSLRTLSVQPSWNAVQTTSWMDGTWRCCIFVETGPSTPLYRLDRLLGMYIRYSAVNSP